MSGQKLPESSKKSEMSISKTKSSLGGSVKKREESTVIFPTLSFQAFDKKELKDLGRRFRKLDSNADGEITLDEFMNLPELQTNPLVSRIIKVFDTENNGSVNFDEFVSAMSLFSDKSKRFDVLRFAFKIYDIDNDGYISNGELFHVLKLMVGDNLKDMELQQIVDKTIIYADTNKDNKISFDEFMGVLGRRKHVHSVNLNGWKYWKYDHPESKAPSASP